MKEKLAKIKAWAKRNEEELWATGILGGMIAAYAGCVVYAVKKQSEYNQQTADARLELRDAVQRGASILPGPEGHWWILEQPQV
jgi:hypothetical protein